MPEADVGFLADGFFVFAAAVIVHAAFFLPAFERQHLVVCRADIGDIGFHVAVDGTADPNDAVFGPAQLQVDGLSRGHQADIEPGAGAVAVGVNVMTGAIRIVESNGGVL